MRLSLYLVAAATLTACGALGVREVMVPIAVPCVQQIPPRPDLLAERAWASSDVWARARALLVDRLLLLSHAERLEALLTACAELEDGTDRREGVPVDSAKAGAGR